MNQTTPPDPHGSSLNLQDLLLVIFNHKWKIMILTALGFAAAAVMYTRTEPLYESRAKLMVRYVLERSMVDPYENQSDTGGRYGDHHVKSEIEIITSWDIAKQVAEEIGPEKVEPDANEEPTVGSAATVISKNLEVAAEEGSNVIHVAFRHADAARAPEILRALVDRYFVKHLQIHRSRDSYDYVSRKTDEVRSTLQATESELAALKSGAGILSLPDAIASLGALRTKIKQDLMASGAEAAEQAARVEALQKALAKARPKEGAEQEDEANAAEVDPNVMADYSALQEQHAFLRKRDLDLRAKYASGNRLVVLNQQELAQVKRKREALLAKHPGLATVGLPVQQRRQAGAARDPFMELLTEQASLAAVQARVKMFQSQAQLLEEEFKTLTSVSSKIESLERQRQVGDEQFRHFAAELEKAKVDEALRPDAMPNISIVQEPSAPEQHVNAKTLKMIAGLASSGLLLSLGWAFLIELVLDRRVKRPLELETRLRLPLMLSIPYMGRKQRQPLPALSNGKLEANGEETALSARGTGGALSKIDFVLPYAEAIRDRLVYYFELNNMTHKPKLVALAGLTPGAGTSTLASGVALAFADDAKVLLVDMNGVVAGSNGNGSGHKTSAFGKLNVGKKPIGTNLFVATVPVREGGLKSFGPKNFFDLVPKFRASEFDYVIFDLPPIDQTSPTLSMAGFMDQVLLVLDADNTDRDRLKRTHSQLVSGQADVTCVFNKVRRHAPRWVHAEV